VMPAFRGKHCFDFQGRSEYFGSQYSYIRLVMEVGCVAAFSGKNCFGFQGRGEQSGSSVVTCRPCHLIPRIRDSKASRRPILSLPKGVQWHKEKNNCLLGRKVLKIFPVHRSY
jgi:hypothetical protein